MSHRPRCRAEHCRAVARHNVPIEHSERRVGLCDAHYEQHRAGVRVVLKPHKPPVEP